VRLIIIIIAHVLLRLAQKVDVMYQIKPRLQIIIKNKGKKTKHHHHPPPPFIKK
jgi:hypothetical protein